ncbi:MAG: hypothetical protein V3U86_06055, partial [Acidobacteriota bacterium]
GLIKTTGNNDEAHEAAENSTPELFYATAYDGADLVYIGEDEHRGVNLGRMVHAAPITYLAQGEQQVTIAVGSALFTFSLE